MSFHSYQKSKAKCPMFVSMVKSDQSGIYGIHCGEIFPENSDDRLSFILRFDDMESVLDAKAVFCDDVAGYPLCKLYRAWHDEAQTK